MDKLEEKLTYNIEIIKDELYRAKIKNKETLQRKVSKDFLKKFFENNSKENYQKYSKENFEYDLYEMREEFDYIIEMAIVEETIKSIGKGVFKDTFNLYFGENEEELEEISSLCFECDPIETEIQKCVDSFWEEIINGNINNFVCLGIKNNNDKIKWGKVRIRLIFDF